MRFSTVFASLSLFVAAPAFAAASSYTIDPAHSAATFTIKHLGVSTVRGEFGKLSGAVELDRGNLRASKVEATIDATTVNTREAKRDAHLKSPDFLDVAKFPTLAFKSTRIEPASGGRLKLTGDLTIHGVTKSVTFDVDPLSADTKTPFGSTIVGTSATAHINRRDFGVSGGAAGALVGDDVSITLDLELIKK
jgi:polyisoprenoid-binding protein YceI